MIRISAIGDCCHTLPVVRTIQAAWPETKITWIIGAVEYELFKGIDDIEFIILNKAKGFSGYVDVYRKLNGRRFPLLLHMHPSMRANLASVLVRANVRIGFDKFRAKDRQWLFTNQKIAAKQRQHVMDGLFGFAETLGLHQRVYRWDIPVTDPDRDIAATLVAGPRPLCVISPCSNQRFRNYRNWPARNYAAVAEHLHDEYGAHVVLTGSPSDYEREYGETIESSANCPVTNLIGKTSLKQLLAIIESADLVVCPDSGPAHMATAVGTPVVGLYATTNPDRARPYFSEDLLVNEYPRAVQREFNKSVSDVRWGERVRHPDAMNLITADAVASSIRRVLGRSPSVDSPLPTDDSDDSDATKVAPDSSLG
jgi:heptosyltransferase I